MISASLTRRISALSLSALVLATGLAAAAQDAHAVKPRKCPDGTIVGCTKPCPDKVKTK